MTRSRAKTPLSSLSTGVSRLNPIHHSPPPKTAAPTSAPAAVVPSTPPRSPPKAAHPSTAPTTPKSPPTPHKIKLVVSEDEDSDDDSVEEVKEEEEEEDPLGNLETTPKKRNRTEEAVEEGKALAIPVQESPSPARSTRSSTSPTKGLPKKK